MNFQNSTLPGPAVPEPTIIPFPIPRAPDEPDDEPHAPRREPDTPPFPVPDPAPDLPNAGVLRVHAPARPTSKDARFKEVEESVSAILKFSDARLAAFSCSFGASDVSCYDIVGA